jgi:hypothetical protein
MNKLNETLDQFTPDNLLAGHEVPVVVKGVTLAKGQGVLKRGTVVANITASGLAKPVDRTKADGTQIPVGILTDTVDTGDGTALTDYKTTAYVSGLFNGKALIFGGTDTVANHETKLRELGIYLKDNQSY